MHSVPGMDSFVDAFVDSFAVFYVHSYVNSFVGSYVNSFVDSVVDPTYCYVCNAECGGALPGRAPSDHSKTQRIPRLLQIPGFY